MSARPRMLFVSPRYLLPADTGAKIRTSDILRGLKGGRFEVVLAAPAPVRKDKDDAVALAELCDHLVVWPETPRNFLFHARRVLQLLDPLPVSVACERSQRARRAIGSALAGRPDLVLVDFPHTAVNLPAELGRTPSVLFTHNVEAEIFKRHSAIARDPLWRTVWRDQYRKMLRFERGALRRFNSVIAVSERDSEFFRAHYGVPAVGTIPTGVDLEFLQYHVPRPLAPRAPANVVFVGSMDWLANIEGIEYFMDAIWPSIQAGRPGVRMTVVGRNPPARLVEAARARRLPWTFTGFVDDVRPFMRRANVSVIPLRVGGGTRMKAYEAMASGVPVVSTGVGIEGLPLTPGIHFEQAEDPAAFAQSVLGLLGDDARRLELSRTARGYVEANFSSRRVARVFEQICWETMGRPSADQRCPPEISSSELAS
ncbi:MAG: glycosyltransferase [Burkholderiales bacterium]